jgi:threonine/homoserine/homoserine lactone efflux protein
MFRPFAQADCQNPPWIAALRNPLDENFDKLGASSHGARALDLHTFLLFSLTVVPLVCTPGPDLLFVTSQGVSGGAVAAAKAVAGVCLGYAVHSALAAFGLAAIVATSPLIFETIRWAGIAYILWLALDLLSSAWRGQGEGGDHNQAPSLGKGLLTSLLNPKGLMVYLAILPQFIDPVGDAAVQALALSAVFILWCAVVYFAVGLIASRLGSGTAPSGRRRQVLDGGAGGLLVLAAGMMALQ